LDSSEPQKHFWPSNCSRHNILCLCQRHGDLDVDIYNNVGREKSYASATPSWSRMVWWYVHTRLEPI
jgi:hypothetical protein